MARSYIGIVQATGAKPLLCGVRVVKSPRFETYAQAWDWCKSVDAINYRIGRMSWVDVTSH